MTDEQWQRKMEFIVEQQAHITVSLQQHDEYWKRVEEERIRDQPRMAAFQESVLQLIELTRIMDERMDNGDFRLTAVEDRSTGLETRSAALEASMAHLAEAQAHADERVSALIDIILDSRNGPS